MSYIVHTHYTPVSSDMNWHLQTLVCLFRHLLRFRHHVHRPDTLRVRAVWQMSSFYVLIFVFSYICLYGPLHVGHFSNFLLSFSRHISVTHVLCLTLLIHVAKTRKYMTFFNLSVCIVFINIVPPLLLSVFPSSQLVFLLLSFKMNGH
jgi:hypothetical protein